ncbi:Acylphosphatase [Rhodobacteraceae bacterium THAF1]|uniref:acylphosphatase n=1 Tax=Palleronia sp. THAF1 TaxID=2587842 RepID=UPI000F3B0228|nr:acylphosphatase [Palleronia sp. THAF1]QFU09426.1 Acylphosphatase [Palleronia sp. THAF1]VDC21933.1 Acylphosphatase [Rhodobacteraceae bacterium THAF1]
MTDAIHVTVQGRVQGVGFRAWTQRTARDLGLTGWVRNRDDGSVEAVFEGDSESLRKMQEALRKGPAPSKVADVSARDTETAGAVDFQIR